MNKITQGAEGVKAWKRIALEVVRRNTPPFKIDRVALVDKLFSRLFGLVAQPEEQPLYKGQVPGSSPGGPTEISEIGGAGESGCATRKDAPQPIAGRMATDSPPADPSHLCLGFEKCQHPIHHGNVLQSGPPADSKEEMDGDTPPPDFNSYKFHDMPGELWKIACNIANPRIHALAAKVKELEEKVSKMHKGLELFADKMEETFTPPPAPAKPRRMKGNPKNVNHFHQVEHDWCSRCDGLFEEPPCLPVEEKPAHICPCIVPGCDIQGGHAHSGKPAPSATDSSKGNVHSAPDGYAFVEDKSGLVIDGDMVLLGDKWDLARGLIGSRVENIYAVARKIYPAPEGELNIKLKDPAYRARIDKAMREIEREDAEDSAPEGKDGNAIAIQTIRPILELARALESVDMKKAADSIQEAIARLERSAKHDD